MTSSSWPGPVTAEPSDRSSGATNHAYCLAVHLLGDKNDAEEITQEAFVRAFRALDRFDGQSEVFTWMYRITVNLALSRIRSRKTALPVLPTKDARLEAFADPKPSSDPAGRAQQKEIYIALCQGIDSLPHPLRTTLILVCVDGCTHEEASQVLGAPTGTIAWRVYKARQHLRAYLEKRGFDPEGSTP